MSKLNFNRSKILTVVYKHFRVPKKLLREQANRDIEWMAGEILFNIPLRVFSEHLPNTLSIFETGIRESILTLDSKKFRKSTALAEYRTCHASTNDEFDTVPYCFTSPGSGPIYAMLPITYYSGNGLYFFNDNVVITTLQDWLNTAYPKDDEPED